MKGGGSIIGYALGSAVIVPLAFYLISIVFYSPNKITDDEINQYIKGSENMVTTIIPPAWVDEKMGSQLKSYTLYIDKNSTGVRRYDCYVFYFDLYKKYFSLMNLCENKWRLSDGDDGRNLIITVNRQDLMNPQYGTKDNPVPVLKFRGESNSLRYEGKDFDSVYMDKVHRENVKIYLEYIMPKKELKGRYRE